MTLNRTVVLVFHGILILSLVAAQTVELRDNSRPGHREPGVRTKSRDTHPAAPSPPVGVRTDQGEAMSDTDSFDPEDYEGVTEKMATVPRRQIRQWEKDAKELREAREVLTQMKRERNFVQAGIPDSKLGTLFMRGYDGPDDVDAIKTAAAEYGILNPPAEQNLVDASLRGHEAAQAAASGAAVPDPRVDLDARMRAAKSAQELAQILEEAGVKPQDLQGYPQLRS